jgi:hypothetical protein
MRVFTIFLLASLLVTTTSCGDDDGSSTDGGGGGTDGGGGGGTDGGMTMDDGGGAGTDGGMSMDDGGMTPGDAGLCALPTLERGCGADENCVIGVHQVDCCGSLVALGMNHSERDAFDTFEAACRMTYPDCDCLSQPTRADDGTTGMGDATVACVSGTCTTTFGP